MQIQVNVSELKSFLYSIFLPGYPVDVCIQPTFVSEWRWFDQDGWRKRSGRRREEKEEQEPSTPPQQLKLKLKEQKSSQRGSQKSESSKVRVTKQEQQWGREIDEGKTSTCSESRRAGQARDC